MNVRLASIRLGDRLLGMGVARTLALGSASARCEDTRGKLKDKNIRREADSFGVIASSFPRYASRLFRRAVRFTVQ